MASKVRRRYILLTYPQCDIDTRIMRDFFLEKCFLKDSIEYLVIGDEDHHATDGVHRHVFLKLNRETRIHKDDIAYRFDICRRTFYFEGQSTDHYDSYVHYMENWYNEQMVTMECGKELEWDTETQRTTIRRWHPNFEAADGDLNSPKRMWNYTKKGQKFIEYGQPPFSEKEELKDKAQRNMELLTIPIQELVKQGKISLLAIPQLKKARQVYNYEYVHENPKALMVFWFFGPTGSGKSFKAREEASRLGREAGRDDRDYWVCPCQSQRGTSWFDGYTGQFSAIFDDYRSGTTEYNTLLQITDGYRDGTVPIKGSFIRWNPGAIFITAPGRPEEIFKDHSTGESYDTIDQLLRRITELRRFYRGSNGEYCSEVEDKISETTGLN